MTLTALRHLPLLAPLSNEDLALLESHGHWRWFQPGEPVVRQGEPSPVFWIVTQGRVEVLLEGDLPTRLGLLGPGDFFGELPALTGEPAPATVMAREVSSLLQLSREGLLQLLERNGELNRQIIATLSARVKEAGVRLHRARLRERSLSDHIARQGARTHPEWVGTGAWSQRVRAAIARGSKTTDPVVFVGEDGAGKELAAARMHYNGSRKDGPFIVLECAEWTDERWAEALRLAAHGTLLLKRADLAPERAAALVRHSLPAAVGASRGSLPNRVPRIMATAAPPDDREPSPVEDVLLDEGFAVPIPALRDRREDIPALVRYFLRKHGHKLSGDAALQPVTAEALRRLGSFPFLSGNVRELERVLAEAALLAGGGVIGVEHLRLSARVGRTGRPRVGLALGGGAVRGCAHIGVLKAFAEAGVPVDLVAGTSSGSLVGACFAAGMDLGRLQELIGSVSWFDLARLSLPGAGFLHNGPMRGFLDRHIGPVEFDGLQTPFVAVAADVNTGQEVILRQGRVADAVRASTAIPGVFKPVAVDGRLLVDGVVVNNVPANVARAMGADLVIAVDVTEYGFTAGPPKFMTDAMMRAFDITARQTISSSLEWADIVIRPQVSGLNGFSTKHAPEFARRGYLAAREAVAGIMVKLDEVRREFAD